jgi:hypothetical protein
MINNRPIFLHALFRTGSTYIWNKFRQNPAYYCYYEPFHPILGSIAIDRKYPWSHDKKTAQFMQHPHLDKNKLYEYKKLLRPGEVGVPYFRKSFSYDNYCENNKDIAAKDYLDYLIKNTETKIPVLKFTRSSFRIKWFKKNYPEALNIYISRNPRNQWQSYLAMHKKELDIFLTTDLIITGINSTKPIFDKLKERIALFEYHSEIYNDEELIYSALNKFYSNPDRYFIFYYIWFCAFILNILYADFFKDVDLLSQVESYRNKMYDLLRFTKISNVSFEDANIENYKNFEIDTNEMLQIEQEVREIVFQSFKEDQIKLFHKTLEQKDKQNYFNNNEIEFITQKKSRKADKINMEKKYFKGFNFLANEYAILKKELTKNIEGANELKKTISKKERVIKEKELQIGSMKKKIDELNLKIQSNGQFIRELLQHIKNLENSESYKIGKMIIFPIYFLVKTYKTIKNHE